MPSSERLTGSYVRSVGPHSVPPAVACTAWSLSDGSVGTSRALLELGGTISEVEANEVNIEVHANGSVDERRLRRVVVIDEGETGTVGNRRPTRPPTNHTRLTRGRPSFPSCWPRARSAEPLCARRSRPRRHTRPQSRRVAGARARRRRARPRRRRSGACARSTRRRRSRRQV
jgi:hypothetical protein